MNTRVTEVDFKDCLWSVKLPAFACYINIHVWFGTVIKDYILRIFISVEYLW